MAALATADAFSASGHRHGSPTRSKAAKAAHTRGSPPEAKRSERTVGPRILLPANRSTAESAAPPPPLPPDFAAAKHAIELVRQHKLSEASAVAASIGDPVAQK